MNLTCFLSPAGGYLLLCVVDRVESQMECESLKDLSGVPMQVKRAVEGRRIFAVTG